jgi:hypothetical protein
MVVAGVQVVVAGSPLSLLAGVIIPSATFTITDGPIAMPQQHSAVGNI